MFTSMAKAGIKIKNNQRCTSLLRVNNEVFEASVVVEEIHGCQSESLVYYGETTVYVLHVRTECFGEIMEIDFTTGKIVDNKMGMSPKVSESMYTIAGARPWSDNACLGMLTGDMFDYGSGDYGVSSMMYDYTPIRSCISNRVTHTVNQVGRVSVVRDLEMLTMATFTIEGECVNLPNVIGIMEVADIISHNLDTHINVVTGCGAERLTFGLKTSAVGSRTIDGLVEQYRAESGVVELVSISRIPSECERMVIVGMMRACCIGLQSHTWEEGWRMVGLTLRGAGFTTPEDDINEARYWVKPIASVITETSKLVGLSFIASVAKSCDVLQMPSHFAVLTDRARHPTIEYTSMVDEATWEEKTKPITVVFDEYTNDLAEVITSGSTSATHVELLINGVREDVTHEVNTAVAAFPTLIEEVGPVSSFVSDVEVKELLSDGSVWAMDIAYEYKLENCKSDAARFLVAIAVLSNLDQLTIMRFLRDFLAVHNDPERCYTLRREVVEYDIDDSDVLATIRQMALKAAKNGKWLTVSDKPSLILRSGRRMTPLGWVDDSSFQRMIKYVMRPGATSVASALPVINPEVGVSISGVYTSGDAHDLTGMPGRVTDRTTEEDVGVVDDLNILSLFRYCCSGVVKSGLRYDGRHNWRASAVLALTCSGAYRDRVRSLSHLSGLVNNSNGRCREKMASLRSLLALDTQEDRDWQLRSYASVEDDSELLSQWLFTSWLELADPGKSCSWLLDPVITLAWQVSNSEPEKKDPRGQVRGNSLVEMKFRELVTRCVTSKSTGYVVLPEALSRVNVDAKTLTRGLAERMKNSASAVSSQGYRSAGQSSASSAPNYSPVVVMADLRVVEGQVTSLLQLVSTDGTSMSAVCLIDALCWGAEIT